MLLLAKGGSFWQSCLGGQRAVYFQCGSDAGPLPPHFIMAVIAYSFLFTLFWSRGLGVAVKGSGVTWRKVKKTLLLDDLSRFLDVKSKWSRCKWRASLGMQAGEQPMGSHGLAPVPCAWPSSLLPGNWDAQLRKLVVGLCSCVSTDPLIFLIACISEDTKLLQNHVDQAGLKPEIHLPGPCKCWD